MQRTPGLSAKDRQWPIGVAVSPRPKIPRTASPRTRPCSAPRQLTKITQTASLLINLRHAPLALTNLISTVYFPSAEHNHDCQGRNGPVLPTTVSPELKPPVGAEPPVLPFELLSRSCVRAQYSISSRLWCLSTEFGPCLLKLWRWSCGGLWCSTSKWSHGRTRRSSHRLDCRFRDRGI